MQATRPTVSLNERKSWHEVENVNLQDLSQRVLRTQVG